MGKAKRLRKLRADALAQATAEYATTNKNVQVQSVKSDELVLNSKGVFVNKEVPKVVFNTELVGGCARKIYKQMKKEEE